MKRTNAPGATVDGRFTDGNPATATPSTQVEATWLNMMQEELANVVEIGGEAALNPSNNRQLLDAIIHMISGVTFSVGEATTAARGIVELATNTEATTGTDIERAVTPAGVKAHVDARVATATARGIVELATNAEVIAGTDPDRAVTPAGLAALTATEDRKGLAERATNAEAAAEADTERYITPAQLAAFRATIATWDAGDVKPSFRSAESTGWFFCYGQAVSRSTYAALFAQIGTTFGNGNGSTTFNLPDLRGRALIGRDNMGGSAAGRITAAECGIDGTVLGASGGLQSVILTTAQIPAHIHTGITLPATEDDNPDSPLGGSVIGNNIATSPNANYSAAFTGSTGGGLSHTNVQPSTVVNWLIKY